MTSQFAKWAARFPYEDLTRNIAVGAVLIIMLLMQLGIYGESANSNTLSEFSGVIEITSYVVMFFMILPVLWWLVDGITRYAAIKYFGDDLDDLGRGETA